MVLNACIYQIFTLNGWEKDKVEKVKLAAEAAYAWAKTIDWFALDRSCEEQLDRTAGIIASDTFSNKIDQVISAAKEKLASE
jgi:hypothetical protein